MVTVDVKHHVYLLAANEYALLQKHILYSEKLIDLQPTMGKLNTVMTKPIPKTRQHTGINPGSCSSVLVGRTTQCKYIGRPQLLLFCCGNGCIFSPREYVRACVFVHLSLRVTSACVCVCCGILTHINLKQWQRYRYVTSPA